MSARAAFRAGLASGRLLRFPGAFTPLTARLIEERGFDGVYISGAVLAAERGLPDIGLTTLTEVTDRGRDITATTTLPTFIDADTGFGEPMNVARTIQSLELAGLAGCHLEDQVNPKRCGHLDGKSVVEPAEMVRRLRAAVGARTDPNFVICARTDARSVEGLDAAIERAKAYVDAGADAIFPEALADLGEFEAVRKAIDVPIVANMTEFGKSELFTAQQLADAGASVVIYPVTLLRIAMGAIERGLDAIAADGTQAALVPQMQTRARLYELLRYADYNAFDHDIFTYQENS
ncbi:methylisocitrate lyase [Kribbella sandramycini]|uniref:Methylisocitrate lyase n=1 Tax=Kribbella sandramycini TaxID=60450 RepID=A0A7Y4KXA5_9ACTN|nr:methylisocitrate lyase [Kribbella sandramycini]MBB6569846.1 methylisocitrate lyase [Kribbella sandramycini]NOL40329.1 methylisocitrate lyase [Kribbella sandramycini]